MSKFDTNQIYLEALRKGFQEAESLGLAPSIDLDSAINKNDEALLTRWCIQELLPLLESKHPNDYWGEQCINLSAQTFAILQSRDFECEIVMGEVSIRGTNEFDTTLEGLKHELAKGISNAPFAIHVWVQIGNNFTIAHFDMRSFNGLINQKLVTARWGLGLEVAALQPKT